MSFCHECDDINSYFIMVKSEVPKTAIPSSEGIIDLIQSNPWVFLIALISILGAFVFLIVKFKLTWKGYLPTFHSRNELRLTEEIDKLKKELSQVDEKLKAYRKFDFFEKTENGEYIGYSVAKKPYVEFWAEGNWNSQEYHIQLKTFEKLWDDEDEIIIYGQHPNLTSDFHAIMETKAKELPSLTIYCSYQPSQAFAKYFKDYENVKIVVRG